MGERRESAHNRGGEKKQRKKGSRHRAYHQQFSTVGSWLSHRDLGGSGEPWWAGAAGLVGGQWGPLVGRCCRAGPQLAIPFPRAEAAHKGHSSWGFPAVQSGP